VTLTGCLPERGTAPLKKRPHKEQTGTDYKEYIASARLSSSHLISSLYVNPSVQQEPDYLHMTLFGCPIEGRGPILSRRVVNKKEGYFWFIGGNNIRKILFLVTHIRLLEFQNSTTKIFS
jgi:hypothetical protein